MKKTILYVTGIIIALIAISGIAGMQMDEKYSISRSIKLQTPVDEVWTKIHDFNELPKWHPLVASVEKLETHPDLPLKWKVTLHDGNHFIAENILAEDNALLTSKMLESSLPFHGNWVFELKAFGNNQTLLILTENMTVPNPFVRLYISLQGHEHRIEQMLRQISTSLGEPNAMIEE